MKNIYILAITIFILSSCIGSKLIVFHGQIDNQHRNSACSIYLYEDEHFQHQLPFSRPITSEEINENGEFIVDYSISPYSKRYWIKLVCNDNGKIITLRQGEIDIKTAYNKYYFNSKE